MRTVLIEPTWEAFRAAARRLLAEGAEPDRVGWVEAGGSTEQLSLLGAAASPSDGTGQGAGARENPSLLAPEPAPADGPDRVRVPRRFLALGEVVACHRERPWPHLYRALWRLAAGETGLLEDAADPLMVRLLAMERAIRRDSHKMKAFVRFRAVGSEAVWQRGSAPADDGGAGPYVAWFEPRHRIVRRTAPFFRRRFASMRWSLLTPDECAHWDGTRLTFTEGVDRRAAPDSDAEEALWLAYYRHTFNPARLRTAAMRSEMPVHYWRNLPEAAAIPTLVRDAPRRVRAMVERSAVERSSGRPERSGARSRPPSRRPSPADSTLDGDDGREPPRDLAPVRVEGVRIGVAGWDYPDWAGRVYPDGRSGVDRLRWVSARFDLIEVNSTFYRPPSAKATRRWLERTADRPHLRFSAKLYRGFTHRRGPWREADVVAVESGLRPVLEAGRLSTLLVQLPWSFKARPEEKRWLRRILDAFAGFPLHVEVRHDSWDAPAFREWLAGRGVGLACIDQPLFPHSLGPAAHATSRLAYIRLHGRNQADWFRREATRDERYDYSYSADELAPWIERTAALAARPEVDEVQVVFNNHYRAQAVYDAEAFARMLRSRPDSAS